MQLLKSSNGEWLSATMISTHRGLSLSETVGCFCEIPIMKLFNFNILSLLTAVFITAFSVSCTDDILSPEGPDPSINNSEVVAKDLPGVLAIQLFNNSIENSTFTRADDKTSEGNGLHDGISDEFDLADSQSTTGEYYHYLLIFDNNDNSTPVVFPLETVNPQFDGTSGNITLTISKVLEKKDWADSKNPPSINLSSSSALSEYLKGKTAYVLLNFKLENNFLNSEKISGNTTGDKLANISRSQLEKLQMTDIKVAGQKTTILGSGDNATSTTVSKNFFIMSNSVYSDGNKRVVDGSIDNTKIFQTEEEAIADPAIKVHVERLAAKVTVSFNTGKMSSVNFGPSTADSFPIESITLDETTGLPIIKTKVYKVDMLRGGQNGIEINDKGYHILKEGVEAEISIMGFGASNLESSTFLYKDIAGSYGSYSNWNDMSLYRCYWAQDEHYGLTRRKDEIFKKVDGYPHQFRQALDTDTVTSFHAGKYNYDGEPEEDYTMDEQHYTSYNQLGEIDPESTYADQCFLTYKSYKDLSEEFNEWHPRHSQVTTSGGRIISYDPFYILENTYFDQGMATNDPQTWRWPWQRAPYATATNLLVLARIKINDRTASASGDNPDSGNSDVLTREEASYVNSNEFPTVYLGQNNIFYLRKVNLLKSKLAILNQVMLSGGNAGIQILHGQWDKHKRWDDDDVNKNDETHLDKVAWNEGSVLWFAKVKWDDSKKEPVYTKKRETIDGNVVVSYDIELEEQKEVTVNNDISISDDEPQFLDLIPAEISGGDGQCLIAPDRQYMGKLWRYYLAPRDPQYPEQMDKSQAVEISYNHLVALIHKIIGPVDVYRNGYMYYSIPIPHRILQYGPGVNTNAWRYLGAFSVVRNNWYDITINQISRLGTPVDVPAQPIIPVMDVKRSYINMGVELKDYHEISQGDIPMM